MDLSAIFGAILRHGLTAGGAYLVSKGYIGPDDATNLVDVLSGAFLTVGGLVWSYIRTKKFKGN